MNDLNKSSSAKDYILFLIIFVMMGGALYSTYWLSISSPIKIIVWIVWVVLASLLSFFTKKGQFALNFFTEAKIELQKIVWPTRHETIQTTTIVMVMVSVTGCILWLIDSLMLSIIAKITHFINL